MSFGLTSMNMEDKSTLTNSVLFHLKHYPLCCHFLKILKKGSQTPPEPPNLHISGLPLLSYKEHDYITIRKWIPQYIILWPILNYSSIIILLGLLLACVMYTVFSLEVIWNAIILISQVLSLQPLHHQFPKFLDFFSDFI